MNKFKNYFYSKKESWWFISFSIFLSSGILIEPQLLAAAIQKNDLSEMWLYWSGLIGVGFSIPFFAHLWGKIPIKTENELILFRFSGKGAKILHGFRSLYLGGLIIPFLIAFHILAFSKIIVLYTSNSKESVITLLLILLIIGTFFNKFYLRIKIDFYLLIVFILFFLALTILIIYNSHGISNFLNTINATAKSLTIIPKTNTVSFTNFLVFICVQWWSASILDYPDMNGQKLLASKSMRDITKTILVPSLVLIVFKIVLLSFTFLVINNTLSNTVDSEFAFANVFLTSLPNWALPLVLVFFGISFLAIVQNHQNWSGSLLAENFYKTYINSKISAKKSNRIGIYCMLYVIALAGIIAFYSNSIMYMVKLLFTITAGVGPVFILRWYWWRINAWSQLSAMVSAMLMPLVYDLLFENNSWFFKMIIALENGFKIDQYPIKIIFLTLFVSLIWITITFLTKPTEQSKVKSFAETVQPGGYWKGIKNSGKLHLTKRLFIWVLLASNSLITIAVLWNFVQLQFFICACLLAVYVLFFFVSYKMLNHINNS